MKSCFLTFFSLLVASRLFAAPTPAPDAASAQTNAYQDSVEQGRVQAQTERVRKELQGLFEEFKAYPAARGELDQLQQAVGQLKSVEDKDMVGVVQTLRQASQAAAAENAKDGLAAAGHVQKIISVTLRALADKLLVEREQTAIRKRLLTLLLRQMAHQHQTQKLVDEPPPPWVTERSIKATVDEQTAINEETSQLFVVLTKLSQTAQPTARQAFEAALTAGGNANVREQVTAAVTDATAKDLPKAVADQTQAIAGLSAMLVAFDNTTPAEEHLQAMVSAMKELTAKENRLAKNSEGVYFMAQQEIKDPQQQLDDEAAVYRAEIAQLSPAANTALGEARQPLHKIDETFRTHKNYMEKEENRWEIIELEKNGAHGFAQTALILEKQAEAMSGAGGNQPNPTASAQDRTRSQIDQASEHIMRAQDHMQAGTRIMQQHGSADVAKDVINKARAELATATAEVSALGNAVSKDATADLQSSDAKAAEAGAKAGTDADQMRNSWTLGGAKEDAEKALTELQAAANRIAAEQAAGKGETSQQASQQPGGPMGGPGTPGNSNTSYSALASFSTRERAALATLEHETVAPEYNTMVEQYRKNLADGQLPTP